jgi:hypothetical protein
MVQAHRLFCLIVSLAIALSSCQPKPATPSPTSIPPQPTNTPLVATNTEPATTGNEFSMFETGLSYSDTSGDMAISFLDVVAFQATVHEESEMLEVVLHMRDIPPTATLGQTTNFIEYSWVVFVYLDPAKSSPTDIPGDYYFGVNTSINDPSESVTPGIPTPTPSGPVIIPINQLLENKYIYDSSGMSVSTLEVVADPDSDRLTLQGRVPGIISTAVFSFATAYYDGTMDRPDNYVPPESANLSTPLPEATEPPISSHPLVSDESQLEPARTVRAYPGPEHYAGDVLTFEILVDGSFDESFPVTLTLDNQDETEISAKWLYDRILLPLAFDTTNLNGRHTLKFSTADGALNQTYSFVVLPASDRPTNAAWMTNETGCCILYYISETAAARDIEFIAEHFQQAAEDFAMITGEKIDPKLDVYIIDRIWGNGGFGGDGELIVSYTDRYYGPTIGAEGLETLARHEFAHAAGVGMEQAGDGIDFNSEGLAVYVAGGHYKPEPLAQRGAALYDLGYYVPVGQYIEQHEVSYLYSAAMLTYIAETHGSEKLWELLAADEDPKDGQPTSLEVAIQSTLGISLNDFDQDFQAWLENREPGEQLDDLRLTIQLQDLRRTYQDTYAPPPYFILGKAADAVARPEYLPVMIREAHAAANVAIELFIANGQKAIVEGKYSEAEQLIKILDEVITTGNFEDALAKDYLEIVSVLADAGYEALSLDVQGDQATAQVTIEAPVVISVELQKTDGIWQVKP